MDAAWLTVDCGNTRCKLVLWDVAVDPAPIVRAELPTDAELDSALEAWLAEHRPAASALTSVGSHELTDALRLRLEAGTERLVDEPDPGLEVRCDPPEGVGRDRLFAARGALEALGPAALIVDVGTALTVDAADDKAFLGGSIAPGPALSARALHEHTARLPEVEPRAGVPALGRSTEAAIQAGVVVGLRGAASALVEAIASEAAFVVPKSVPVAVTGGARHLLLEPEPFTTRTCVELRDLVHLGLLFAAREAAAG